MDDQQDALTDGLAIPLNAQIDDAAPELSALIDRMRADHARQSRTQKAASTLPHSLKTLPLPLGRCMPPLQDCEAAHRQLIADPALGLGFQPAAFPAFDGVLAAHCPAHLQPTLAVLRNALLTQYLALHPPLQAQLYGKQLQRMARHIAAKLTSNAPLSNDGKGAQQLYLWLLQRRTTPLWQMPSMWFVPSDQRPSRWPLLPLAVSPFSDAALHMPAPQPQSLISDIADVQIVEMTERNSLTSPSAANQDVTLADELNAIANDIAGAGALTMSVEQMQEPSRRESVEIAKEILEKLRVLAGEVLLMDGLSAFGVQSLSGIERDEKAGECL
jgi:hypothetical protein